MESENKKQTQKIDWQKKGLGWIPDYPDLRDYKLEHEDIQKDGRLKIKGDTDKIEDISEAIINILKILDTKSSTNELILTRQNTTELKNQIGAIETQILGNIKFLKVRLYRLLRKQEDKSTPSISRDYLDKNNPDKNNLDEQIIALKQYLSILVLQEYLEYSSTVARKLREKLKTDIEIEIPHNNEFFKKPAQLFGWIEEPKFDKKTEFLVMLFQYCSGMTTDEIDGIVGFKTYTTLKEYFGDDKKLDSLKTRIAELKKENSETNNLEKPSFSQKMRLVYVPSMIPEPLFKSILQELKSPVKRQVLKEYKELGDQRTVEEKIHEISEVNLLKSIGLGNNESQVFVTLIRNIFEQHSSDQFNQTDSDPDKFLTDLLETYISTINKKIFENEFFVVEPIVSFVIKIMSPMVQSRNQPIKSVVTKAINKSQELFRKAFLNNSSTDKNEVELAKETLRKVAQSFVIGIKLVIPNQQNEDEPQDSEINSKLCFYFIVKKILNQFVNTGKFSELIKDTTSNIFDKQELFEVESLPELITDSQEDRLQSQNEPKLELIDSNKNKLESLLTHELQIPVSNSLIESLKTGNLKRKPYLFLPSVVDLSYWASPVEDQGALNSCTAFAGIALLEYFTNKSSGQFTDLSPLFLYKAVRNLMSLTEDVGASVRETMKAMALFGVPPEQYWPYEEGKVNEEPPSFCYSYAQNFQALKYFRLDYAGMPTELLLSQVKAVLAAGFPCMFGFTVYTSVYENSNIKMGYIPFPNKDRDQVVSGHAVVAMGYDDLRRIPRADGAGDSQGAFLIRNSWGTEWGKEGYGWIPYEYALQGLTRDWWSLLKSEWFDQDSDGSKARSTDSTDEDCTHQKGGCHPTSR